MNIPTSYTLQDGDYTWTSGDGKSVGTYTLKLTQQGIQNIEAAIYSGTDGFDPDLNPIHNVELTTTIATIGTASFEIKQKAISNVKVTADDQSKTYDGQAASLDLTKLETMADNTISDIPVTTTGLTADDFDWYDQSGTKLAAAPTAVGQYEARLKTTALAQLQSANPNYAFTEASGTINYQITAKPAAVTVSGAGSKVYDGKATSASDVLSKVALKADLLTGQSLDTSTLTADDYSWFTKNADGTYTAASNPASAGTYYLQLNSNGISKLNAANPNYDFTASGDFTYTIDKSANVATVSGTQTETYSGTAKSVNYKADGDNSVKVTFISSNGGKVISGVTLSSDDFEIVDATGAKVDAINAVEADGTTPTNYHIVLTDAGLAKLRKAVGDNYSISKDASYGTLKINPRVAHAVLSGTGSTTYTGQRIYPDSMEHGGVTLTVDIPKNDEFYTFFSHSTTGNLEYSSDNGLTWTENRPKDVGTYLVRISADGLAAIKANYGSTGNIVWEENGASTITGQATLTVVKTAGTAVLSGVGKKTYDGSPITSYKTPIALKVTALTTQGNKKEPKTITLTAGTDYVWKLGSETHTTAPSDVGKYTIELTDAGKQKIKDTYTNIDWGSANSSIKSVATYEIDPVAENSVLVNTTDGNYSKTYDGTATHTIDAGKFTLTTPLNGNSVKLDTTGIDDSSYEWVDANGNKIDDPVNVGTYYVKLTNSAFATLQSHNKNYTLTNTGLGTYTITQATASATLSGSRTRAYNGQAVTDSDLNKGGITLTITYPQNGGSHSETVDLASGDYTWNTTDHAAPVNASDTAYTLSLNADHIKQLIEGKAGYGTDAAGQKLSNVKFADDAITGSADYTITKLAADATIANNATAGNYSKTYDGTATTEVDPSKLTISTQVNGKTVSLDTSTLTAGDYQWVDAAGNALSSNPQAVGTYHIALTADGLAKLNAANPNFTLTQTGTGTYTITQADASGVLSGSNSKTYNGNAVSLTELNSNGSIKVALTIPGLTGTHSYTLKTGDYYISGNATDAGTYTVSLTSAGVTAVKDYIKSLAGTGQDGQSNVQFADDAITGSATFTINASANVVKVGGSQTETYTGQKVDLNYQANGTNSVTITIANAAGNTTGKTADASTVTLDSGDFTVEGDPINVGTYHVVLTDAGVAKVQNAVGKNYQISQDSSAYGSLVITKATGTATLNGAGEKAYDGTAISSYTTPVKVTITAPNTATTVDLTAGTDYVWKKDGQTYTTAPVDAGDYTIELTAAGKAKITAENAANIDWANSTITSEATYKINKATATVGFTADSGQTVNYNGKTGQFDSTKFVPTISTNNGKTLTIPAGVALSLAGGDFAIDNDSTEPTELGSYTVKLTDTGLAKLKSATNNYNWVNNTSATYAIQKTTGVSVTLADKNGGQSVAYKGTAFDNSEIDVNDYAITLGNGQTYTLKNGDLEFAPNQDPTNTGTYQVQLSEQGKNAISALDSAHYSYKVESAGQGTFTITKATPQVVMKGAGQKVYDGTAITSYTTPIGITITAPGNPTLTLDSQDYQFVAADGTVYAGDQAPVNVGDYKIELTETGKEKIRQNTDDDTNLDWSKVDFANIGNGTYTITQAAGKAVLSGSNHRVYTGSQVTTADLNKTGGNIVVTISVSGVNKTIDYKLQDGDYSWTSGNATDAATYTLELNKANILQHLKAKIAADSTWKGNVDLTDAALTGSATFTVDPSANVVSVSGTQNESYTGSPISVAYEQGGSNSVKVTIANAANNADGATAPLTNVTLDSGDFRLAGESGNSATNHGTYRVVLTDAGIAKIQAAVGSNYAISQSDTDAGKLVISKATASAKLTGNGSSTYNGQPITVGDLNSSTTGLKVTVTGPTANASAYSLSSGDVEFSTDGQNWTTTMPTDAKTYQVRLTDQGKNGIISQFGNDNLVWTNASGESTITSDASYKINPLASDSVLANASDYTKTYDGAATSTIDPSKLKLTTTVNGQTVDLTTTGIDGSSFEWVDQDGNAISAPKNVGTYYLKLTDAAFATLQADNPNFTLTNTGLGKYTITQANASATLSGSGRRAYNGKGVTLDDLNKHDAGNNITLTIKYPANGDASHSETVALTADDFVWNTSDGSAPVDANSQAYTLSLKPSAIQKLIEDKAGSGTDAAGNALSNVTFADDAITGTADYTITSLSTAATISNNGDYGKTYDAATTDTIDPSKLKLTTQVDGQTVELNTTGMTGNDYEWVNATGNALSSNPKDVGTYYIKLTDGGLRKLQSLNPNFTLTQTGLGKYVISAAEATGTLTGSNSKVYDGNAISLDEINQGGQIKVNLNFPGSNSASYTLKDTDYDITGNATDAGSYTITLNSTGVTNVENYLKSLAGTSQSGDSNVKFADNAITGSASFTITASTNNATVSGTQTETYTGSSIGVSYNTTGNNSVTVSFKSTNGGKDLTGVALTSGDFQIVDADGNPTTAINAGGTYHIVLTDAGVTRIQSLAGNNYTISKDSSYGTLVIDKAIGKATFSGTPSYAYTGKAVSPAGEDGYLSKYTLTLDEPGNPTYTLQDGDVEFKVDGNWTTTAPVKVGTYAARLSQQGWNNIKKINSDNVTWSATASTAGTATYTITEANVTAALSGNGYKVYNGSAVTADELYKNGSTIKVELNGGEDIANLPTSYTLKQGDYEWVEGTAPTNVGKYHLKLTAAGISSIQAQIDHVLGAGMVKLTTTADQAGQASFEIKQTVSGKVQLHGNEETTYDGTVASFNPSSATDYGFNNAEGLKTPTFDASDFDWYSDAAGTHKISAPTNAGTYYLLLNANGKKKWADANPNYSFVDEHGNSTITGSVTYTIKQRDLVIELSGQASKVYDGSTAAITADDLSSGKIKISWNNGSQPTDIASYTLSAGDLEVVNAAGNAVKNANASGNVTEGNPVYTVRLTAAALERINNLTGAANYKISQDDTEATYLIYTRKAQLTLTGSQTTTYGTELALDPNAYNLDFSNWVDTANHKPTKEEIGLKAGSLYIDYGTNNGSATDQLPKDAGKYQVKASAALIARLKSLYPDYDFEQTATTDASHEPATYVISPAAATVTITGTQKVKYGESTAINAGNYKLTITATVNGVADTPIFAGQVKLTNADLEFVTNPTNVGDYRVKLSEHGLEKLANLSISTKTGSSNYDWTQAKDATAGFEVTQMPVTITVNDAKKSVVYGSQDWKDALSSNPSGYSLSIATEGGAALSYTQRDGDVVYAQKPGNVGDYEVELSADGLNNIKTALGTNYEYPEDAADVTTKGTFTVKQGKETVQLTGHDGRTYDAKSTSVSDLDMNKYSYTATIYAADGQPQTVALTADDLEIVPNNGSTSNVGTYKIQLSNAGQEKLKALDGNHGQNYQWTFNSDADYVITASDAATAKLSGSNSKVYDGNRVTIGEVNSNSGNITVTLTYPGSNANSTYTITAGDLDWYAHGHKLTEAPQDVGTYTIKLKDSSLTRLKARLSQLTGSNVQFADTVTSVPGSATFTITPEPLINVTVSGDSQDKTYDGQPASLDVSGLTVKDGTTSLDKGTLSAGDFDWYDAQGNKLTAVPTNAGKYQARLKSTAYQKLQTANTNYEITEATGTIDYEIKQAPATAAISGSASRAYDGSSTAASDVLAGVSWTPSGLVTGQSLSTTGIDASDYEWFAKNADGTYTALTGEPTNVGTYSLKFKQSSISKLRTANTNYSFANDAVTGEFTYTITPASENVSATLSGSNHKTYDGQPVTNGEVTSPSGDITVTLAYPGSTSQSTYTLQAGDYAWYDAQDNSLSTAPTKVGSYTIKLTAAGLTHLQAAIDRLAGAGNVTISENDLKGSAGFDIQKKDLTVTLADKPGSTLGKTYDGQPGAVSPTDGQLTAEGLVGTDSLNVSGLTAGDFDWYDAAGNKLDSAPTNVGNYHLKLNHNGQQQLADDNPNYQVSESGQFGYQISQAAGTITTTGHQENTTATIDPSQITVTIKLGDNGETTVSGLTKDDFQFADGTPSESGTYKVELTPAALKKLQDENSNYQITASSNADFQLDATLTISFVDDDEGNQQVGSPITQYGLANSTIDHLSLTIPAGYKLAENESLPTSYTFSSDLAQSKTIHLVHKTLTVTFDDPDPSGQTLPGGSGKYEQMEALTKKPTRTITVTKPDGSTQKVTQEVKFTRTATYDEVTGKATYSDWTHSGDAQWAAYTPVAIPGYTAGTVAAENVTPDTENATAEVGYTANDQTGKISYQDEKGNEISSTPLSGKTGEEVAVHVDHVPAGWQLVTGQPTIPDTVKATATGIPTVVVKIEHATITVHPGETAPTGKVPGNPSESYPTMESLTKTPTRTITITKPDGTSLTVTQQVEFTRTATFDEVTGAVTYSDWTHKGSDQWAVYTPETISGYTASPAGVAAKTVNADTTDEKVEISYTANEQTGKISYQDAAGTEISSTPLSGKTGTDVAVNPVAPAGWKIVAGQTIPNKVHATANGIPTVVVQIEHATITVHPGEAAPTDPVPGDTSKTYEKMEALTKDTTRTITITKPDTTKDTIKQTVHFTRTATFDEVTGEATYSPWTTSDPAKWAAYTVPTIAGYTPSQDSVAEKKVDGKTADETVNISYTAGDQVVNIKFVDDDDGDSQVGTVITKAGKTGQTLTDFSGVQVPAHYALASGQSLPTSYTFTADKDQTITIHLVHAKQIVDPTKPATNPTKDPNWFKNQGLVKDVTRTINYEGLTTDQLSQIPEDQKKQTVEFTRTAKYDEVTGKLVANSESAWTAESGHDKFTGFTPKSFAGYTADPSRVAEVTPAATDNDSKVTVTYTANDQTVNIKFVDDDNNDSQVGTTITKTGKTGDTIIDFSGVTVPDHYELASGQKLPTSYTFTADADQTITIHLKEKTRTVDPTDPTTNPTTDPNWFKDHDLTKDVTRTINDHQLSGTTTTTQTATIHRTATYNEVTDKLTNLSNWSTDNSAWTAYSVTAPAGYTATIKQTINGHTTTINQIGAVTVNANTPNETIDITYTANDESLTINFVDDDKPGQPVVTTITKGGKNGQTIALGLEVPAHY